MYEYGYYQISLCVILHNGNKAVKWGVIGYDLPAADGSKTRETYLAGAVVDTASSWINLRDVAKQNAEDFVDAYRSLCTTYDYRGSENGLSK